MGEISEETLEWFLPTFNLLDKGNKPITIKLTSGGGDTLIGFAMYDLIKNSKNKVIVEVYGYAYSIAALILEAADVRLMTGLSGLLIHDTVAIVQGDHMIHKHVQLQNNANELRRLCNEYYTKIAQRTGQKIDFIKKLGTEDRVVPSAEALKLGFIDKII